MKRLQEILTLLENPEKLSDEQLAELEDELRGLSADLLAEHKDDDEDLLDDETMESLGAIAEAITSVRSISQTRIAEAEAAEAAEEAKRQEQAQKLDELLATIKGDDGDDETGDDETDDGDVELKDAASTDGDDLDEELNDLLDEEAAKPAEKEKESVTASVTSLADIKRGQPKKVHAQPKKESNMRILAGGMLSGEYASLVDVERALVEAHDRFAVAGDGRVPVARFKFETDDKRTLREGTITDVSDMADAIRRAPFIASGPDSLQALTADGGLCAPVNVWYGLETISQAERPLRASLVNFNATRGGIKFQRPTTLADIDTDGPTNAAAAIGVITEAEDAAGTYDKSVQRVECGAEVEVVVDAVYKHLEFGNFIARTNPERTTQFTDLTLAAFARFNEQRLFAAMRTNSTPIGAVQALGALRDLLNNYDRAGINYRARHRMLRNAPLRTVLPFWVAGFLASDQVNALQSYPEQYDFGVAEIERKLADRNIRVTWYVDDFTTAQAGGAPINAYPSTFHSLLFHEGAHVYVDNGTLDLGLYRDSTLIESNLFRTFSEEFWNTAMWGVESFDITWSLCANGASAGSIEPACGS